MKTKLHMRAWLWMAAAGLLATLAGAEEFNNIEYLCCDWGPAMTMPSKTNAAPQFSDTEEEIYFLKQLGSFTRKKGISGNETMGRGIGIYLCKMKSDGSGKTEIKELWRNPNHPIDTQAQSTWMDVNARTRKIAFSITYAGSDVMGLWTMNLDGSELKHLIKSTVIGGKFQRIDSPSWTPDGEWIVYREETDAMRLAKCDRNGENAVRFMGNEAGSQCRVSPDGRQIAYIHHDGWASILYLANIDGTNPHPLPAPDDKRWHTHGGTYPAWSPDGDRILYIGIASTIADISNGKIIIGHSPQYQGKRYTCGWPHWGKTGIVGFSVGGILFTDSELKEAKWLGSSGLSSLSASKSDAGRW
jgi:hypothetical protein